MGGIVEILQSRAVGCEVKQVFSPEKVTTVVVSAAPTESLKTESPRQEGLTTQQKSQIAIRWREASKVIHGSRPRLSLQLECRPTAAAAAVPRMASLLCRPQQQGRGETPAHPTIPISQKLRMKGDKTTMRREMTITKKPPAPPPNQAAAVAPAEPNSTPRRNIARKSTGGKKPKRVSPSKRGKPSPSKRGKPSPTPNAASRKARKKRLRPGMGALID